MGKHFEDLWEESENLFKDETSSVPLLIMELKAKLSIYEGLDKSDGLPSEEKMKLKSHLFGKILASLTQLSLLDNVNTFKALTTAINDIKIEKLELRYSSGSSQD